MTGFRWRGHNLHVTRVGQGAGVLLLHSSGLAGSQWRRLQAHLSADHRTVAPDLLGYGQSDRWPNGLEFQLEMDLEMLEALAATLEQPLSLVGHSYGGFLALRLAARARIEVAAVAVYEPVAFGVLRSREDVEGLADLPAVDPQGGFFDLGADGLEGWLARFVDYWNGPGAWLALSDAQRRPFRCSAGRLYAEVRAGAFDTTAADAYEGIGAPTLLLSGAETTVAARRVCAILAEVLPLGEHRVVAGAGHMGPLTHAASVNALIGEHLRSASRRKA